MTTIELSGLELRRCVLEACGWTHAQLASPIMNRPLPPVDESLDVFDAIVRPAIEARGLEGNFLAAMRKLTKPEHYDYQNYVVDCDWPLLSASAELRCRAALRVME